MPNTGTVRHYECTIVVGKYSPDYLRWINVRRSDPILVDAKNRQLAKNYVREYHVPKFIRPGESLIGIPAPIVSTAYVMEMTGQKSLFDE